MSLPILGWLIDTGCPWVGTIMTIMMWFSPLTAVMEARRTKSIGSLNPLPFGIIVLNCVGWIIYGSMLQDYFIFVCNIVGLILGLFYLLTSMVLIGSIEGLGSWRYRYLEILLFIGVALYSIIGMILGNSSFSSNMCRILVATTANSCTIIYYASPCSTMYEVMKTKNSSSLYSPMISANICTSILWFIYGYLSIHDPFVYIPNGIGILLSMFQFSLVIIYPNYSRLEQKYEKVDNGDSNK